MARAEAARARAYAPYSGITVGAALRARDGRVVTAGNVENASYGLSICAERAAVARALAEGVGDLAAVAVAGPGHDFPPCGACRQVLAEHLPADAPVSYRRGGAVVTRPLRELIPDAFTLSRR